MKDYPQTLEEIEEWLRTELTPDKREKRNITDEDMQQILRCLHSIAKWYWTGEEVLGHFLTYVVQNDFIKASTQADGSNVKALDVYARFLYNRLPSDWRLKALAL